MPEAARGIEIPNAARVSLSPVGSEASAVRPDTRFDAQSDAQLALQWRLGGMVLSALSETLAPSPPLSSAMGDDEVDGDVTGVHLRAARAMLGWAMSDLASRSSLSLSTIKRLEQHVDTVNGQSRTIALDTLRANGIAFLRLGDGTIAVTRSKSSGLSKLRDRPRTGPAPDGSEATG